MFSLSRPAVSSALHKKMPFLSQFNNPLSALDWAQEYFECCGMRAATDYKKSSGMATYWITTGNSLLIPNAKLFIYRLAP